MAASSGRVSNRSDFETPSAEIRVKEEPSSKKELLKRAPSDPELESKMVEKAIESMKVIFPNEMSNLVNPEVEQTTFDFLMFRYGTFMFFGGF